MPVPSRQNRNHIRQVGVRHHGSSSSRKSPFSFTVVINLQAVLYLSAMFLTWTYCRRHDVYHRYFGRGLEGPLDAPRIKTNTSTPAHPAEWNDFFRNGYSLAQADAKLKQQQEEQLSASSVMERRQAPGSPVQQQLALPVVPDSQPITINQPGALISSPAAVTTPVQNQLAVFYNVFIPKAEDMSNRAASPALAVIKDQLAQLHASFAADGFAKCDWRDPTCKVEDNNILKRLRVYYTTIGHAQGGEVVKEICSQFSHLSCIHTEHYDAGQEEVTLQKVLDYCTFPMNHDSFVIYLHSKGTFHPSQRQNNWRHHLTHAATSQECLLNLKERKSTPESPAPHICGLYFAFSKSPFFPGNMWAAKCAYVKDLAPLPKYEMETKYAVQSIRRRVRKGQLTTKRYIDKDHSRGMGRYANEFWACSHPGVVPSDVAARLQHSFWLKKEDYNYPASIFRFSMAPRKTMGFFTGKGGKVIARDKEARIRESFFLGGQLIKWFRVYKQHPPPNSWVWKMYPDGQMWKEACQQHGRRCVDVITQGDVSQIGNDEVIRDDNGMILSGPGVIENGDGDGDDDEANTEQNDTKENTDENGEDENTEQNDEKENTEQNDDNENTEENGQEENGEEENAEGNDDKGESVE